MLILDAGGVSRLAERSRGALALVATFRRAGLWPPVVPSAVLVESLTGRAGPDARANRLLKTCVVEDRLPEALVRRAAELRHKARRGSAIDALTVASAEPGGVVLTGDIHDITALASHARGVTVERI